MVVWYGGVLAIARSRVRILPFASSCSHYLHCIGLSVVLSAIRLSDIISRQAYPYAFRIIDINSFILTTYNKLCQLDIL